MPKPILRVLERHAGSTSILMYLSRKTNGVASDKELAHEAYLRPHTALSSLEFLSRAKLIRSESKPEKSPRRRPLSSYQLTENGKKLAAILCRAEDDLETEQEAGTIPADLEDLGPSR